VVRTYEKDYPTEGVHIVFILWLRPKYWGY
jgi:hypothetical protein